MLFTVQPLAIILAAIRPGKDTFAFFLVIVVISFIFSSIWPCEHAKTLHLVGHPGTIKDAAVSPGVDPVALYVVFLKITAEM